MNDLDFSFCDGPPPDIAAQIDAIAEIYPRLDRTADIARRVLGALCELERCTGWAGIREDEVRVTGGPRGSLEVYLRAGRYAWFYQDRLAVSEAWGAGAQALPYDDLPRVTTPGRVLPCQRALAAFLFAALARAN